jgi:hypothetical protein
MENTLPVSGPPTAGGLVLKIDGLRLIPTALAAVAILADLFQTARPDGKGGRP